MSDPVCGIAADAKLETPEGPLTVKTVGRVPTAVMTRTDDGEVRFAMTTDVRVVAEARPVIRLTLENGRSLRVAPHQVLLAKGMREVRAAEVRPGDELESVFVFPDGYVYRADEGGDEVASRGTVGVKSVENGGEADVYAIRVPRTGRFAFGAGVLGVAERAAG